MDAYAVVMLTEEDDVMAVVPKSWCSDEGCYWPPYASNARIQRAVQSQEMPLSSYEKATAWLRHTEDTPSSPIEEGRKSNLKRTKRMHGGLLEIGRRGGKSFNNLSVDTAVLLQGLNRELHLAVNFAIGGGSTYPVNERCDESDQREGRSVRAGVFLTLPLGRCLPLVAILQKLADLDSAVAELRSQVEFNTLLLQNAQNPGPSEGGEEYALPADVVLPLQNKQQLTQLEKRLAEDQDLQDYLVSSLASKGGRSVRNAVRVMVPCLISNVVARGLNWTGAGEKLAFRDLVLRKILHRGIRRNLATKDATDEEIQREVSVFLRGASDREGGRRERMLRSVAREMVSSLHQ